MTIYLISTTLLFHVAKLDREAATQICQYSESPPKCTLLLTSFCEVYAPFLTIVDLYHFRRPLFIIPLVRSLAGRALFLQILKP